MKIYQKLALSFLATTLLLGINGYIALRANLSVKPILLLAYRGSLNEIEQAEQMNLALREIETTVTSLNSQKFNDVNSPEKVQALRNTIHQKTQDFKHQLALRRQAIEASLPFQDTLQDNVSAPRDLEVQELNILTQIETEFSSYEALINQYLVLSQANELQAKEFLTNTVNNHYQSRLVPLLDAYNADTHHELLDISQDLDAALSDTNQRIVKLTLLACLASLLIGGSLSYSVLAPIYQLKNASDRLGKGKLDTRIKIQSKDEFGSLAQALNQMISNFETTMVSKTYVENIINSMVDSLIVVSPKRIITKVNQATLNLLGYEEQELLRKPVEIIFTEDTSAELTSLIQKNFIGSFETAYLAKNGRRISVHFSGAFIHDDEGRKTGTVFIAQDITQRRQAELALHQSEARNQAFLQAIPDLMFRINRQGICLDFRDSHDDPFSQIQDDLIGKNVYDFLPLPLAQQWIYYVEQALQTNNIQVFEYQYAIGTEIQYYEARIATGDGEEALAIIRNITEQKQVEERLLHDALHDALTGLANRALFMDRLTHVVNLAKRRKNYLFAVLFLDLDRFKVVNDSLGHIWGDRLLTEIADRLQKCIRAGDTIARLGGDEFALLLEDIQNVEDAVEIANRIHKSFSEPFSLDGHEIFAGASIGIALSSTDYELPEELLRDADTAMYRAKASGKGRSQIFDKAMHAHALTQLQIENDLRRAVERQEFQVYYQPIVSLASRRTTGFEALVRWQHPELGMIFPGDFIPVAEETGLILEIGEWVLRQACSQMQSWQEKFSQTPPFTISVNLSAKQFLQKNLVERVETILQETGLDPCSLKLEITESVMMEQAEVAAVKLKALQNLGVHLSIDDFGTGYSSLAYLHSLPINTLKIDRSFVNSIDADVEKLEIIQTIVKLAWNLGFDVVAEGVETKKQLAQLRALKCESGQGFLFAKPMNSKAVEALITTELQERS